LIGLAMLQVILSTPPIAFDLARIALAEGSCSNSIGGEIVVCGSYNSKDRLTVPPPTVMDPMLPNAEMRLLGKATVGLVASHRVVSGVPSNSIMATIKIPFLPATPISARRSAPSLSDRCATTTFAEAPVIG
jgi:hypothetical protein